MGKVYITNGNLKKIITPFAFKGGSYGKRDFFVEIKDFDTALLSKILSMPEIALLDAYREMLADMKESLAIFKKVEKRDFHKYVYEGAPPAYHFKIECERLKSDFVNYEIPEILKGDIEGTNKFREIFRQNIDAIKEGRVDLARLFINNAMGWDANFPSVSAIDFKNSNPVFFANDNLEEIERRIMEIMFDAEKLRNSSEDTKNIIKNLGYGTHKRKESSDPEHPLFKWHWLKVELKHAIQTYFRIKLNPDLAFEGEVLDQLGFRPCSFCSRIG